MIGALKYFLLADLRQKYLRAVFGLWVLMAVLILMAGELSQNEQRRIVLDFGFSMTLLISVGIGSWGTGLRFQAFRRDGLLAFLSLQGFPRWRMITLLTLLTLVEQFVFVFISALLLRGLLLLGNHPVLDFDYVIANAGLFFESFLVAQMVFLAGFWIRPFLLLPLGFAFSLIGHSITVLFELASKRPDSVIYYVSEFVRTFFPHLYRLNFRHAVTDSVAISALEAGPAFIYSLAWSVLLLSLTIWFFRSKELVV